MPEEIAVAVQCFVKTDTLQGLLDSLLHCEGHSEIHLFIRQDNAHGSRREPEFIPAAQKVQSFIIDFMGRHGRRFRTLDYRPNERNLGPYATCKVVLDDVFKKHDFAIFLEDDVVLSSDALLWFREVQQLGLLAENNWAIAGQSIFFDAKGKVVDQEFIAAASRMAQEQNLVRKFTVHQFVPSSCFATTSRWWAEFGALRGEPRGDVLLCERTKGEARGCVFPIVPRAKDVGMLHDYGFSVTIHTKEGVHAITNPYLLAEDLLSEQSPGALTLELFDGDAGLLYRQTTLLEGYFHDRHGREEQATAASDARDWRRAAALWNALREEFPKEPLYWLKSSEAFLGVGMSEPATRILDEAVRLFPNHNWIAYRHIRLAHDAGRWDDAAKRAARLREASPNFWPGWVAEIDALAMLCRINEAEELAREAVKAFPDVFWPNYWLARLSAEHCSPQNAVPIWTELVERFPAEPIASDALKAASSKAANVTQRAAIALKASSATGTELS